MPRPQRPTSPLELLRLLYLLPLYGLASGLAWITRRPMWTRCLLPAFLGGLLGLLLSTGSRCPARVSVTETVTVRPHAPHFETPKPAGHATLRFHLPQLGRRLAETGAHVDALLLLESGPWQTGAIWVDGVTTGPHPELAAVPQGGPLGLIEVDLAELVSGPVNQTLYDGALEVALAVPGARPAVHLVVCPDLPRLRGPIAGCEIFEAR